MLMIMNEVDVAFELIAGANKLEMNHIDYLTMAFLIIGAFFGFLFLFFFITNIINMSGNNSGFSPPWRR